MRNEEVAKKEERVGRVKSGAFSHLKIIKTIEDEGFISSLCFLKDGRLVLGDFESRIVIYSESTYQLEITIENSHKRVSSLCGLRNGNLASSGYDGVIKIWEIKGNSHNNTHALHGHFSSVHKVLETKDAQLLSSSADGTIRIWDSQIDYRCVQVIKGHINWVRSILEMGDRIISCGDEFDRTMRMWEKPTFQCNTVVSNVYCCYSNGLSQLNNNTVILGGNHEIFIVDVLSFESQSFKDENLGYIWSVYVVRDDKVLVGNNQGEIICFDASSNKIICIQEVHVGDITCIIKSKHNQILSSSYDSTINIYEILL